MDHNRGANTKNIQIIYLFFQFRCSNFINIVCNCWFSSQQQQAAHSLANIYHNFQHFNLHIMLQWNLRCEFSHSHTNLRLILNNRMWLELYVILILMNMCHIPKQLWKCMETNRILMVACEKVFHQFSDKPYRILYFFLRVGIWIQYLKEHLQ